MIENHYGRKSHQWLVNNLYSPKDSGVKFSGNPKKLYFSYEYQIVAFICVSIYFPLILPLFSYAKFLCTENSNEL